MTGIGIALIIMGVAASVAIALHNSAYTKNSAKVCATVFDKRRIHKNGVCRCELTAVYSVSGVSYNSALNVPKRIYGETEEGDLIQLRYSKSNPKHSMVDGRKCGEALCVGIIGILFAASGVAMLLIF